jgi:RNA polymerase sigma factor (TIGR02999 family)
MKTPFTPTRLLIKGDLPPVDTIAFAVGGWDAFWPSKPLRISHCFLRSPIRSTIRPTTCSTSGLTTLLICEKLSAILGFCSRRGKLSRRAKVGATISSLMVEAEQGDRPAAEALFAALYAELHRLAKRELARRGAAVSLSATTLLHEAYLDISARAGPSFPDQPRFMGYAARVMRGLIIDHARERHAQKRGGLFELTSLDTDTAENAADHRELVRISETLDELGRVEPALAEVVDLKFFCGFSFAEIAAMRNVSERTVQRNWEKARIYLHRQISADLSL